jgi:hypothetical protein
MHAACALLFAGYFVGQPTYDVLPVVEIGLLEPVERFGKIEKTVLCGEA